MVAQRPLAVIRDVWLRAVLALTALWLLPREPWLALMALWFTVRWVTPAQMPSLVTWTAIGATWFALRALPAWAWSALPPVWLAIMCAHVAILLHRQGTLPAEHPAHDRPTAFGVLRLPAPHGSPAITALALALMAPFCPWYLWPILALGLYITWSWLAFIGVAVGLAWIYPALAGWALGGVGALLSLWVLTWYVRRFHARGQRWFEWTPRGDSFDSVLARLILWYLIPRAWWQGPRWFGHGPRTLDDALKRWAARCWIETPNGEAHVEWAQMLYEYGVVGLAAVVCLVVRVVAYSHVADPYAAVFISGLVMTFAHWAPARQPAVALVVLACAAGALR